MTNANRDGRGAIRAPAVSGQARKLAFALALGLSGAAVLIALGLWQMQRLAWKQGIIAGAEAMIANAPVALPVVLDPLTDRYRAVTVAGRFTGEEAHVLTSTQGIGPGFLVIAAYETAEGRRILIDRGFVAEDQKTAPRPAVTVAVAGNLNWPDDVTSATPQPDTDRKIWFGRDVAGMSAELQTEPVLIIARTDTGQGISPRPVTTAGFRNDHLEYAITWFSLAAVWLGMTAYLVWRIRTRSD